MSLPVQHTSHCKFNCKHRSNKQPKSFVLSECSHVSSECGHVSSPRTMLLHGDQESVLVREFFHRSWLVVYGFVFSLEVCFKFLIVWVITLYRLGSIGYTVGIQ
jgi:hypothetical protein